MSCDHVHFSGGLTAIVCSRGVKRGRRPSCYAHPARPSEFQCDARLKGANGKTCDRHLCHDCAMQVAEDKHLCPIHAEQYLRRLARAEIAATGAPT